MYLPCKRNESPLATLRSFKILPNLPNAISVIIYHHSHLTRTYTIPS